VSVRTHEYEIVCSCGNRWRLDSRHEPEHVECPACGARTAETVDLGQMRPGERGTADALDLLIIRANRTGRGMGA
jgi:hypothetical protein